MMFPAIDNPASCEIHAVNCFLQAKNMNAAEIHLKLFTAIYGQNVQSEGTVRQWCRMFKDGRENVHDQERIDRLRLPSPEPEPVLSTAVLYSVCRLTVHSYNSSARIPRKTPSSIVKNASLLIHYLARDVLLLKAFFFAEMCLPTRCLAMGIHVTILIIISSYYFVNMQLS
jgi:hypothetical protein